LVDCLCVSWLEYKDYGLGIE